jgi:hypothetical protein
MNWFSVAQAASRLDAVLFATSTAIIDQIGFGCRAKNQIAATDQQTSRKL